MITCVIQYTLDPSRISAFEEYATAWPPIIERCGGRLVGYYLPKEGANNFALALVDFDSLADYERYREKLADDPDAQANFARGLQSGCMLAESRSFLRRV
jgi:hypothetical protein